MKPKEMFEVGGGDCSTAAFQVKAPTPEADDTIAVYFGTEWEVSGYAVAWQTEPTMMSFRRLQNIAAVHFTFIEAYGRENLRTLGVTERHTDYRARCESYEHYNPNDYKETLCVLDDHVAM